MATVVVIYKLQDRGRIIQLYIYKSVVYVEVLAIWSKMIHKDFL